jgi:homoserine trans-succinylase
MGKRVHVCKKYVIEYSSAEGFNWKQQEFKDLLRALGCEVNDTDNTEITDGFGDNFECPASDFKRALDFLKKNKDKILNYEDNDDVVIGKDNFDNEVWVDLEEVFDAVTSATDYDGDFDKSYAYCLNMLTSYYKERDKKNSYMNFSAY